MNIEFGKVPASAVHDLAAVRDEDALVSQLCPGEPDHTGFRFKEEFVASAKPEGALEIKGYMDRIGQAFQFFTDQSGGIDA